MDVIANEFMEVNKNFMNIAYLRVSSVTQNLARQEEEMKNYNIEKFFVEKASAKDTNRPQLQAMLDFCREGDCIYIKDFSRLARSTRDLLSVLEFLKSNINVKTILNNCANIFMYNCSIIFIRYFG